MVSVVAADSKRKESFERALAAILRYMAEGVRNSEEMEAQTGISVGGFCSGLAADMMDRTSSREGDVESWQLW